jgi:uncharacterized protein YdeI (YjbR/CyaY-like superfamily)
MKPTLFLKPSEWRTWLDNNHKKKTEVLVGFFKAGSGKPSMTWSQSVDEALCFGWIDGVRKSIDKDSYCIRFTPRKLTSIWSAVNIKKVEELIKQGLMQSAGLEAFKNRKEEKSKIYSFESTPKKLADKLEKTFKANKTAWGFFIKQPPLFQKTIIHWIMTVKQGKTQLARLKNTITESEKQKRLWAKYK